jgi:type VI secretion system FHA domain protein
MILTLEVIGEQAERLGAGRRKVFNAIGGTIGRLPDNTWVFADPYVSGRHALIRYLNERFFIEDTSTNGVFINAPDSRLPKGQAHPLKQGDVIYMDTYQIKVSIEREALADDDVDDDPLAALKKRAQKGKAAPPLERGARLPPLADQGSGDDHTASLVVDRRDEEDVDNNLTEWFGSNDIAPAPPPARARQAAAPVPPKPVARPPTRPVAGAPRPAQKLPPPPRQPSPSERTGIATDGSLETLLKAAGVDDLEPTDELARTCGEILRVVVNGLMDVLRAREQLKEELRIRSTTFKPANNNPLKFSADAEDAFHNLLVKQNSAYLSPPEAFAEALQDIRDHQQAVHTALRIAFETMLAQFDPNRLQEEFDRQTKKGSILGVPAKLRYWDLYKDKYGAIVKDAEASFRTLFGNEFARAYEEHIERLKGRGRSR